MTNASPGAAVLRFLAERGSTPSRARSTADVAVLADERYGDEPDALLDVYFPAQAREDERLATVVWIHGGAWIFGAKSSAAPWFTMLARHRFTVVSVEYSRPPSARYPVPIVQVNDAIAFAQDRADRFHVDADRLVVGGDSAGAQMASQVATLVTSPSYSARLGIRPSAAPEQLAGTVLFGGAYDGAVVARSGRPLSDVAWRVFSRSVLWSYTGSRIRDSAMVREMSTIDHVTGAFPPTFVSGGNADPLTDAHSRPLAARLAELGVDVESFFFASDHTPPLGHQYQFQLDNVDARAAWSAALWFLRRVTGTPG